MKPFSTFPSLIQSSPVNTATFRYFSPINPRTSLIQAHPLSRREQKLTFATIHRQSKQEKENNKEAKLNQTHAVVSTGIVA